MKYILLGALLAFSQAFAEPNTDPLFEPGYAADLPEITVLSLEYEQTQFQFLAEWKTLSNQIQSKQKEAERKARDFQRAKQAGVVSLVELTRREFAAKEAESEVKRTTLKMLKAKINMGIFKQRMLAAGDASYDARPTIVRLSRIAVAEALNELNTLVAVQEEAVHLHKLFLESGEQLYAKKAIALTELEKRRADYNKAVTDLTCAQQQIEAAKKMQAGIEKSGQRLNVF